MEQDPETPQEMDEFNKWKACMGRLSLFDNVYMKLSGAFSELPPPLESPNTIAAQMKPWVSHAFQCFGAERIMFGSDWPVCLVACAYTRWLDVIHEWLAPLSTEEQHWILEKTAVKAYGLTSEGTYESH